MRIVHIINSFEVGGMETMILALAKYQQSQGHEVSVVAIFGRNELYQVAESMGLSPKSAMKRPGADFISTIRTVRRYIKDRRAQIVHSHNLVPHYFAAAACLGMTVTLLNTRHDMGHHYSSKQGDLLYKLAMKRSSFGVAVCEAARVEFVSKGAIPNSKSRTVVNGIDLSNYGTRSKQFKSKLLESLGVKGEKIVFGNVGRVNPVKDHATMLTAFRRCLDQGLNAILVIAGDGPAFAKVKQTVTELNIEDSVFFLGQRSDVPEVLQGFDVFLQSSLTEGYSLALVEAATCGLPIIATNVGGNSEIISDGENGRLVTAQDIDAYAQALVVLGKSEQLRQEYGNNASLWAQANGSVQTMYERYLKLYTGKHA
jgi:glycosyltransferase involved in cell wall biosynthesis